MFWEECCSFGRDPGVFLENWEAFGEEYSYFGIWGYFGRIPRHFRRKRLFKGRPQHHAHLLPLLPETGQPETKPGRGRCPSAEEKGEAGFWGFVPSFLPLKQPQPPPLTLLPFPAAKPPREPGAVPLPQLLADRKSVRWDEEERDEAEEPRRAQGPAGGSERVGHPGEMQDTDVLAGFCQRLLFPPDTGVLPAPPNTSSLPPEFLSQLRSCRRSCKSLRSAPNLPSPTLPLPLATALGVLECCRSPLR